MHTYSLQALAQSDSQGIPDKSIIMIITICALVLLIPVLDHSMMVRVFDVLFLAATWTVSSE